MKFIPAFESSAVADVYKVFDDAKQHQCSVPAVNEEIADLADYLHANGTLSSLSFYPSWTHSTLLAPTGVVCVQDMPS